MGYKYVDGIGPDGVSQSRAGLCCTYGVALAQGLNVQEGQRLLALEELEGGDLACIEPWCEPSRFLGGTAA